MNSTLEALREEFTRFGNILNKPTSVEVKDNKSEINSTLKSLRRDFVEFNKSLREILIESVNTNAVKDPLPVIPEERKQEIIVDPTQAQQRDRVADSIQKELFKLTKFADIALTGTTDSQVSKLIESKLPTKQDITDALNQKSLKEGLAPQVPGVGETDYSVGIDKNLGLLSETFKDYGEESEDGWQRSLDSASSFFNELDYKASVEWKNAISKPIQVSAPSVQVDTSGIETSIKSSVEGINFGDIFSKVPEGLTSGWDNLVNFFEEAGKKAKEFLDGKKEDKWRWPWESPTTSYNGNRLNIANTGFNLAGFTAAAQEEVLNSGFSSNIVVANDTEIIAPKSSLNQLASLLLRQSDVGRGATPTATTNENHIVFNISGAADPEAVAAAVMEKMDIALSQKLMNNRVPNA